MKSPWLAIIGMGDDGPDSLTPKARAALSEADHLFSGERLFALIPDDGRPRTLWQSPLKDSLANLKVAKAADQSVCVIATGDPLSYGIGNWLLRHFSRDEMTIIPGVSAFALACARLGWPQHEVRLITLHGRPDDSIRDAIAPEQRIIALSEDASTPAKVCNHLVEMGYPRSEVSVLTHLDGAREKRFDTTASDGAEIFDSAFGQEEAHDLNVVAIACKADDGARRLSRAAGLPDETFTPFSKMTKRELRALAIARLAPQPGDILWDVGAGSGSVSIEFLRLAAGGKAYLFDIDGRAQDAQLQNAKRFGLNNIHMGRAGMPWLDQQQIYPYPDAIFMGGGIDPDCIDAGTRFLNNGGRFVAHAVTIESEMILTQAYLKHGGDLSRICVARIDSLGPQPPSGSHTPVHGFRPAMTVTQWVWEKPFSDKDSAE